MFNCWLGLLLAVTNFVQYDTLLVNLYFCCMRLSLTIALRYLFGKKSTQAIQLITWISITGMAIGTAALLLILSVFNGFDSLLSGMLSHFNPDVKITLKEGKFVSSDSIDLVSIKKIPGIGEISLTIEETAFFDYKGSQEVGILKGVDDNFVRVTQLDSSLIAGEIRKDTQTIYAWCGSGMSTKLSVNPYEMFTQVTAYMPNVRQRGIMAREFSTLSMVPTAVFSVSSDVDMQYILSDFGAVNALLGLEKHLSAIEIRLEPDAKEEEVIRKLSSIMGKRFSIQNRYQQDEHFLRIMNIEKWISYLIACLTLMIIAFNLVGSLWMIVLEKKRDISILQAMGLPKEAVRRIFLLVGLLVSALGMCIGYILATGLYFAQKNYGLIAVPDSFLTSSYPIEMRAIDFLTVTLTVFVIGVLASVIPSRRAGLVTAHVHQE
jgi:lipoprotein-releasing system permease protein